VAGTGTFSVPSQGEFAPFYRGYVERVGTGAVVREMDAQLEEVQRLLVGVSDDEAMHRYAPGKWSVKEVVGHIADTERIMAYRALRIARGDATPLAGFDENAFVAQAGFDRRTFDSLLDEWVVVRHATLALFRGFGDEEIGRAGISNGVPVTVRALAYIVVGHVAHHLDILRERYGVE